MPEPSPFLRWVGGKTRLITQLETSLAPGPIGTYFEPFLGAGSLFFRLQPDRAVLGDANPSLVACYEAIKQRPDLVWRYLSPLKSRQDTADYYTLRSEFNSASGGIFRRAALFIYLNKTCFNGVWRVNRSGGFNVPYGAKSRPGFPTLRDLVACSNALQGAELDSGDFERRLPEAKTGDFAYFDPPYVPLSATAFFRHYTMTRFSMEDHERVALAAAALAERGVHVLVTEGDDEVIRKWYRDFRIRAVDVRRSVSCNSVRVAARELIITSY